MNAVVNQSWQKAKCISVYKKISYCYSKDEIIQKRSFSRQRTVSVFKRKRTLARMEKQGTSRGHKRSYRDERQIKYQPRKDRSSSEETSSSDESLHLSTSSSLSPLPVQSPPKKKIRTHQRKELENEANTELAVIPNLPSRPEIGSLGRSIELISNCFPATIPSGNVYHYDIEIFNKRKPSKSEAKNASNLPPETAKSDLKYRCLNTKKNREVMLSMLETNNNFLNVYAAYDGKKNMYTRKEIDADFPLKCYVKLPGENPNNPERDVFKVTIKPAKKKDNDSCAINLDSIHALYKNRTRSVPQEAITALETILRHGPCLKFTPIGRSFFYPPKPEDLHPLGGGREIWFGYHQSLRLGQWNPMVNLDITASVFYQKGPVLNYIAEFMKTTVEDLRRGPELSEADIMKISNELKNIRIETNHMNNYKRKYRIIRLVRKSADRLQFTLTLKKRVVKITVADYFKEQYDMDLEFPHLPCLQVCPENRNIYLPVEVCDVIEGQHCKKKLEERQNADMIRFTARAPRERFYEINEIAHRAKFNKDVCVREFGIEVSREPLHLEGRVLDAPNVKYKNKQITPNNGTWDMREAQFLRGAKIENWVLINLSNPRFCHDEHIQKFAKLLEEIGTQTGIELDNPVCINTYDSRKVDIESLLSKLQSKYKADLAVIIVPGRIRNVYAEIKQAAETVVGLVTQCVRDDTVVKKCIPQLIINLCQKINAKMGGVNCTLNPEEKPPILRKPVMLIGADVTHPGRSNDIKHSLAACVGSMDSFPSRYATVCRAQVNTDDKKQSIEEILDLEEMVVELLRAFYRNTNGKKPEKIIYYRDGVSEGQFEKVRDHEIRCIGRACRTLQKDYQPGITVLIVQKRHHNRFMPLDYRDGVGRMNNIPPGTTIDTVVTHPLNFDFFLCSHFGLQGTSRPSRYTVIEDDNEFSSDELQQLTYYLCHIYARCTRSISIPAPVAYAHLAAFRARQHYVSQSDVSSLSNVACTSSEHASHQAVLDAIQVKDILKHTMYYV